METVPIYYHQIVQHLVQKERLMIERVHPVWMIVYRVLWDQCSGRCEDIGVNSSFHWREYFGDREGLSSPDECKICPSNYDYFTCNRPDTNRLSEINDWDTNDTEQKYNFTQLAMKLQLRVLDEYQYLFSYMEVLNMLDNNTFFVSREYLDEEEPLWWCTDPECTVKPWDDVKYGYKSPVFE
jgi:hypothetical protein